MGLLSIKRAIKRQRKLHLAYQDATLAYIKANKSAGTWTEADAIGVMVDQMKMRRYWL